MRYKGVSSHFTSDYAAHDEPEMMTQTDAMRTFRLSLDDLKPLRVKLRLNPVDPRFAPMKLYRIADLQVRCLGRTRARCAAGPIAAHARRYLHSSGARAQLMS